MIFGLLKVLILAGGCTTSCPLPIDASQSVEVHRIVAQQIPFTVEVEVVRRNTDELVHLASGYLRWNHKQHLGGVEFRGVSFDRPDYEVNSKLITPTKVWTST